jgi:hypothetical protein
VWRSIPGFRGDAAVTTWIYRAALNAAIAWTQKERRHRAGKQGLDGVEPAILQASPVTDPRIEWLWSLFSHAKRPPSGLVHALLSNSSATPQRRPPSRRRRSGRSAISSKNRRVERVTTDPLRDDTCPCMDSVVYQFSEGLST